MQISSITNRSAHSAQESGSFAKVKQAFQDIGTAINDGKLDDAKAALAQLQKNAPSPKGKSNPIADKVDALSKALDSGDTAAAKSAYADLQKAISQRPAGARGGAGRPSGPPPGGGEKAGGAGGSSSSKVFDPKDTNQDGKVSAAEEAAYELQHTDASQQPAAADGSGNSFEAWA